MIFKSFDWSYVDEHNISSPVGTPVRVYADFHTFTHRNLRVRLGCESEELVVGRCARRSPAVRRERSGTTLSLIPVSPPGRYDGASWRHCRPSTSPTPHVIYALERPHTSNIFLYSLLLTGRGHLFLFFIRLSLGVFKIDKIIIRWSCLFYIIY